MSGRRSRQGGGIGLIVILVALVIVAFLYKDALKSYLLSSTPEVTTKAATPGERARSAGAIGAEAIDTSSSPVAPRNAIDRARGIEDTVKQQAEQRAKQSESTRY
jgi:hypothetical protein